MKQFIDFIPIVLFVAAYFATGKDIYQATIALMVATTLQVIVTWLLWRKVSKQLLMTFVLATVLGGLTVFLHDPIFLIWKPTVVNWAFTLILLAGQMTHRNPLKSLLGSQLPLPDHAWRVLAWGWALGFFVAGALNLYVAFNYSQEFWVGYKLWGGFGLTFIYVIITTVYLSRGGFMPEPAPGESQSNP